MSTGYFIKKRIRSEFYLSSGARAWIYLRICVTDFAGSWVVVREDGVVAELRAAVGEQVSAGAILVVLGEG